ncbi:MAG: hypothetical protein RL486_200 [Actinomycetota bacterium]
MLRILSHVGQLDAIRIPDDIASQVEVIAIPMAGDIEAGIVGDVLITTPTDVATLEDALSRGVKWVHLIGTGIDKFPLHLIGDDLILTNSRGLSAVPISEWVMACMLSFVKRMPGSFVTEQPKHWNIPSPSFATLDNANLAILGLGGIGTALAQRALPFGMNVTAMRNSDAPSPVEGVRMVRSATELVADADHVVLVAPLTGATRGLFNDELFAAMKPGVQLINVARGPIIDDDALLRALDSGIVACADIDATEPEPLPNGHWMYSHPSVRLSPHVSWNWSGAFQAMYATFIDNLRLYLNDEPLLSVVNPADGY